MTISFFEDWTYVIGADYSQREDCVHTEEVDFDPSTQILVLQPDEEFWYKVLIEYKIVEWESYETIKARIKSELISAENYEEVETEYMLQGQMEKVTFDKSDVWPMIVARFFNWDTNTEMAYLQRWNYLKDKERNEDENLELEMIRAGYEAKEKFKNFILSLK